MKKRHEYPVRKYQKADQNEIDYGYEVLEGCSFAVRGPLSPRGPDIPRKTIACLGSAATFGRHVHKPYSMLLAESSGAHVINLGVGGGRPERYLNEPKVLELCRGADLVVIELMSARSYPSDFYKPVIDHRRFGGIGEPYASMMTNENPRRLRENKVSREKAFGWAAENLSREELQKFRQQMLDAYTCDACALIETIGRPVVLLWLSRRSMDAQWEPGSYASWICGFPHFVDRETVTKIGKHAIGLVDITTTQPPDAATNELQGRQTIRTEAGDIVDWGKGYYASPAMHVAAAERLQAFLSTYWSEEKPKTYDSTTPSKPS